jgi:hypothetical protein
VLAVHGSEAHILDRRSGRSRRRLWQEGQQKVSYWKMAGNEISLGKMLQETRILSFYGWDRTLKLKSSCD